MDLTPQMNKSSHKFKIELELENLVTALFQYKYHYQILSSGNERI